MTIMDTAERRIKGLQKEFLAWAEAHPILYELPPTDFNNLRKRVFRGTFEAYRLGVIGPTPNAPRLSEYFLGWLDAQTLPHLSSASLTEVTDKCFATALEAFRIGVMVSLSKKSEDLFGTSL
jgi:hypothetical protein